MTSAWAASKPSASADDRVAWVLRACDLVDARLAGHEGATYLSPPQPRASALALVALLIGPTDADSGDHWTVAIAGGRRVVDLTPAD
jgi:hypothetical protein